MYKRRLVGTPSILCVLLALTLIAAGQVVNAAPPAIGNCTVFPASNPWNMDVGNLPTLPNSANYIASINSIPSQTKLHADFGDTFGIPYVVVPGTQPKVPINFFRYADESDVVPYPIPPNAPIEGNPDPYDTSDQDDRHVLAVDGDNCKLYELYNASRNPDDSWNAANGAVWDFTSNGLRHFGWTSADAAGLPIFPGLARYDEVQTGAITHALRFTVKSSQKAYILPATHFASTNTNPNLPPMGLRLRLKASFDISTFNGQAKIILQALKTYGMIVADNGSNWYISGAPDPGWVNSDLDQLKTVPGSAFEAVYTGPLITNSSGPTPANAPKLHYFTTATPTVMWTGITWAVRYDIEIAENSAFIGATRYDAHNALSFTWPSALPNAPFYWHVRACSTAVNCAAWSAWDAFVVNAP